MEDLKLKIQDITEIDFKNAFKPQNTESINTNTNSNSKTKLKWTPKEWSLFKRCIIKFHQKKIQIGVRDRGKKSGANWIPKPTAEAWADQMFDLLDTEALLSIKEQYQVKCTITHYATEFECRDCWKNDAAASTAKLRYRRVMELFLAKLMCKLAAKFETWEPEDLSRIAKGNNKSNNHRKTPKQQERSNRKRIQRPHSPESSLQPQRPRKRMKLSNSNDCVSNNELSQSRFESPSPHGSDQLHLNFVHNNTPSSRTDPSPLVSRRLTYSQESSSTPSVNLALHGSNELSRIRSDLSFSPPSDASSLDSAVKSSLDQSAPKNTTSSNELRVWDLSEEVKERLLQYSTKKRDSISKLLGDVNLKLVAAMNEMSAGWKRDRVMLSEERKRRKAAEDKLLEMEHFKALYEDQKEVLAQTRQEGYRRTFRIKQLNAQITSMQSRLLPEKRKSDDAIGLRQVYNRAHRTNEAVGNYQNPLEQQISHKRLIDEDVYNHVNAKKKGWVKDTNKQLREWKRNDQNIFEVAITEYSLHMTQRQCKGQRMISSKDKGIGKRSIQRKTTDGVIFGAHTISEKPKQQALLKYEMERYKANVGFYPIEMESREKQNNYVRINNNTEGDGRKTKSRSTNAKYIAAVCDAWELFKYRLKQFVTEEHFELFNRNMIHYKNETQNGKLITEWQYDLHVICTYDGFGADGHHLSKDRTLHHLKICGWPKGIEGSPAILMRVLQVFDKENGYYGYYVRQKYLFDTLETKFYQKQYTQEFEQDGLTKKLIFNLKLGIVADLQGCKRDKGWKGPTSNVPCVDVVIYDPVSKEVTWLDKQEESLERTFIPFYYPDQIQEDGDKPRSPFNTDKHVRFIQDVPNWHEMIKKDVAELDKKVHIDAMNHDNRDKTQSETFKNRTKQAKTPFTFVPRKMCYNYYYVDPLHYSITAGRHWLDNFGKELIKMTEKKKRKNQRDPKNVANVLTDKMHVMIDADTTIRSCFHNQWKIFVDGIKGAKLSLTNMQITRVLRRFYDILLMFINGLEREDRVWKMIIMAYLLNSTQKLRQIVEKSEFKKGLNDPEWKKYEKICTKRYRLIVHAYDSYNLPYEMWNFWCIQHKLRNIIKKYNLGLGICSTSAQEHMQKIDKNMANGHSNYHFDEIIRHSNLSAASDGIDRFRFTRKTLKEDKAIENVAESRYTREDEANWCKLKDSMKSDYMRDMLQCLEDEKFDSIEVSSKLRQYLDEYN